MTIYALLNGAKEVVGLFSSLALAEEHRDLLADRDVEEIEAHEVDCLVGSVKRYQYMAGIDADTGGEFWCGGQPVVEVDLLPERVVENSAKAVCNNIEVSARVLVGISYISVEAARELAQQAFLAQKEASSGTD